MSGRLYKPTDYPLRYIVEDIKQWPISRLSADRENFIAEVKKRTKEKIKEKYNTPAKLRDELIPTTNELRQREFPCEKEAPTTPSTVRQRKPRRQGSNSARTL